MRLHQLENRSRDNDELRRVINFNDANAATKAMNWFDTPGTLGYGVEYATGTTYMTLCSAPEPNTAKVVTGIAVKNLSGGAATVNIFLRKGGVDYKVNQASTIAAGATAFMNETLIVHNDWYLRGYAATANIDYTSFYSIEPYGVGIEPYNVAGEHRVESDADDMDGTGVHVLVTEPLEHQRRIIRTVSLGNHWSAAPVTTLSVREISTANTYAIGVYTTAAYGFNIYSHRAEGAIVLRPDTELIAQHSVDPTAFSIGTVYSTVDVGRA